MIPVAPAPEPGTFQAHVRKRGLIAIRRLLGKPVSARGRKPKVTYAWAREIPADRFPSCWTDVRTSDGKSALDDLMDAYGQYCSYLAMRIEWATGSPTVDHFIPKQRNWKLVYKWSNYRLSAACVNGAKGTEDVVDPFTCGLGWFELDLDTFIVKTGANVPAQEVARADRTLPMLNLRQCIAQRREYITRYQDSLIDFRQIEFDAPFIAFELRRQGRLLRGDV